MSRKERIEVLRGLRGTTADDLLTEVEAAALLGLQRQTLAKWRCRGSNEDALPFVKIGARSIRYRKGDVERFIQE